MITIEQNGMIKTFSVAAVVCLPPTLAARIYGINCNVMPEQVRVCGYPWALGPAVAAAVVTYQCFKRRGSR
jgi:magnesium transporter